MNHLRRCTPHEGCKGQGWDWDATDSGSGRTVYCDCLAGRELRAKDDAELEAAYHAAMEPDPNACPRCAGSGTVPKDGHFDYCDCNEGAVARATDSAPLDPLAQMAVARAMGRFHRRLRELELEREGTEDDGDWA